MNIVEALTLAKEQGKKVRPVGVNWCVAYEDDFISGFFRKDRITMVDCQFMTSAEEILKDWEVVKEKPSKETQYKIDSMKFQIVRHCKNTECCNSECELYRKCIDKVQTDGGYSPKVSLLNDWSLKEIVEAYHLLKKEGEI